MKKNRNKHPSALAAQISERTNLPVDALGSFPRILLNAGHELMIEGSCRIAGYSETCLHAVCGRHTVSVTGLALRVKLMNETALVVCGTIRSVSFDE